MPVYKAEAIVLRRTNLGEADRIVTLFARDQGKIRAVAKGTRKPTSRLAGRLELFSHVRVLLAAGRTLDVVAQAEVANAFAPLRTDLDRLAHAAFAVELVDRGTADREPAPELFRSLRAALDHMQGGDAQLASLWLAARLVASSGYAPVIDRCQVCGRSVRGGGAFSYALGGVLCQTDHHRDPDAVVVSAAALRTVGDLMSTPPDATGRLVVDRAQREEVGPLLRRYVEYRLDTKLKSPQVIEKLTTGTESTRTGHPRSKAGHPG